MLVDAYKKMESMGICPLGKSGLLIEQWFEVFYLKFSTLKINKLIHADITFFSFYAIPNVWLDFYLKKSFRGCKAKV